MKRLLLLAVGLGLIAGCDSPYNQKGELETTPTETMCVEGCQYISLPGKYGFSHKGNCDNPIHYGKGATK